MQASLPQVTVGLDLGDKSSWLCVLDEAATIVEEARIPTTPAAMRRRFSELGLARVALGGGDPEGVRPRGDRGERGGGE